MPISPSGERLGSVEKLPFRNSVSHKSGHRTEKDSFHRNLLQVLYTVAVVLIHFLFHLRADVEVTDTYGHYILSATSVSVPGNYWRLGFGVHAVTPVPP